MNNLLESFIFSIREILREKLYSIVLFGSRVSGEEIKYKSDYNLLIVLTEINYETMEKISGTIKKWLKAGNSYPIIFTIEEIKNSTDVFPLEFMDIKDAYKILYGKDVLSEIFTEQTNLRHQCEYELRSNLMKIRQAYILHNDNNKKLKEIMALSLSSFLTIFKGIIHLHNEKPPTKKIDSLEIISKKIGFDLSPFLKIKELKENKISKINYKNLFQDYLKEIEKVVKYIDNL